MTAQGQPRIVKPSPVALPRSWTAALSCAVALACATGEDLGDPTEEFPVGGAGPMPSSTVPGGAGGFVPVTGGAPPIGGAPVTGGAPATGGAPITGGAPATGGVPATGGTPATGGAPNMDVERCLTFSAQSTPSACESCACSQCTQVALACFDSGDMARDEDCRAIIQCGQANGCSGVDCYCGATMEMQQVCSTTPQGACVAEIQAAAGGSTDINVISDFFLNDPNHAINRAGVVGGCAVMFCAPECGF